MKLIFNQPRGKWPDELIKVVWSHNTTMSRSTGPFQMVMFTLVKVSNMFHLDNLIGIIFIYVGFGAGLSVFMFTGFIRALFFHITKSIFYSEVQDVRIQNHPFKRTTIVSLKHK